jgi:hypothetical protein
MDKRKLETIRAAALLEAKNRAKSGKDQCVVSSDYFNAMVTDIADEMIIHEFNQLAARNTGSSWEGCVDTASGAFTPEECERARGEYWE